MYMYMYMYMYVHIYIYIERERYICIHIIMKQIILASHEGEADPGGGGAHWRGGGVTCGGPSGAWHDNIR